MYVQFWGIPAGEGSRKQLGERVAGEKDTVLHWEPVKQFPDHPWIGLVTFGLHVLPHFMAHVYERHYSILGGFGYGLWEELLKHCSCAC